MSETDASKSPGKNPQGEVVNFHRKGIRVFGLDLQDVIKFFFGGNASLAIIVLILIFGFLAREAFLFFPDHHRGLQTYRKTGQEFVDLIGDEVTAFTSLYSNANVAYFAEVNRTSKTEDDLLSAYRSVLSAVKTGSSQLRNRLEDDVDDLEDILDDLEDADDEDEKRELNLEREKLETIIAKLSSSLRAKSAGLLNLESTWVLENKRLQLSTEQRKTIHEAVLMVRPGVDEEHPFIANLNKISAKKKAVEAAKFSEFKATVKGMQEAARPLKDLNSELKKIALATRREADKFESAPARRAAMIAGAEKAIDPEERARKLAIAKSVIVDEPDYAKLNQPLYGSVERHRKVISEFKTKIDALVKALPKETQSDGAEERLRQARSSYGNLKNVMVESGESLAVWRHEKNYPVYSSIGAFFLGQDWITNSSWHDFYGLLPLLIGSLLISVIALTVAVPFSVAAAIYVNQLAREREQKLVKPAIEFIGAIPSVVLGFFGIMVLGEGLRELSQVEWLSWIPGFPMQERLNILNAGLLLAFMAIPTIFTLAEDALENVPGAFTEASLALGASKLQTILRVVVPTSLSGIIAASLLGFGRIVGETMVVLLVAGNKIKIPDFTAGLGVVTQPVHTMTGLIAQEIGEVDNGSLHWRALFMVGMILLFISLAVNYSAQKILKRFQQI